jgi:hypothetical protein
VDQGDQGKPGNQGPWPVSAIGPSGSGIPVTPALCTTRAHKATTVGTSSTNTPGTQLTGRDYIQLCVSVQNGDTVRVKCRSDGTAPVFAAGNPGDVLDVGDCVTYAIADSVVPLCISNSASAEVASFECAQ